MRSMTGAGVAHASAEGWRCHVRLASVNHRFLDVVVRLPERLRGREPELRQLVAARLARGRVEVEVAIEPEGDRAVSLALDEAAVEALHQALGTLREKGWIAGELAAGDLLRLPSLLRFGSGDEGWGEGAERLLRDTVTAAMDALIAAREAEGEPSPQGSRAAPRSVPGPGAAPFLAARSVASGAPRGAPTASRDARVGDPGRRGAARPGGGTPRRAERRERGARSSAGPSRTVRRAARRDRAGGQAARLPLPGAAARGRDDRRQEPRSRDHAGRPHGEAALRTAARTDPEPRMTRTRKRGGGERR